MSLFTPNFFIPFAFCAYLSGDMLPSAGVARVNGHDVSLDTRALKSVGVCPQFDALIMSLSARETLTLFGRLKGIREVRIEDENSP